MEVPDADSDDERPHCLTGFSASAAAASVIATEESRSTAQLLVAFMDKSSNEDEVEPTWGGSKQVHYALLSSGVASILF